MKIELTRNEQVVFTTVAAAALATLAARTIRGTWSAAWKMGLLTAPATALAANRFFPIESPSTVDEEVPQEPTTPEQPADVPDEVPQESTTPDQLADLPAILASSEPTRRERLVALFEASPIFASWYERRLASATDDELFRCLEQASQGNYSNTYFSDRDIVIGPLLSLPYNDPVSLLRQALIGHVKSTYDGDGASLVAPLIESDELRKMYGLASDCDVRQLHLDHLLDALEAKPYSDWVWSALTVIVRNAQVTPHLLKRIRETHSAEYTEGARRTDHYLTRREEFIKKLVRQLLMVPRTAEERLELTRDLRGATSLSLIRQASTQLEWDPMSVIGEDLGESNFPARLALELHVQDRSKEHERVATLHRTAAVWETGATSVDSAEGEDNALVAKALAVPHFARLLCTRDLVAISVTCREAHHQLNRALVERRLPTLFTIEPRDIPTPGSTFDKPLARLAALTVPVTLVRWAGEQKKRASGEDTRETQQAERTISFAELIGVEPTEESILAHVLLEPYTMVRMALEYPDDMELILTTLLMKKPEDSRERGYGPAPGEAEERALELLGQHVDIDRGTLTKAISTALNSDDGDDGMVQYCAIPKIKVLCDSVSKDTYPVRALADLEAEQLRYLSKRAFETFVDSNSQPLGAQMKPEFAKDWSRRRRLAAACLLACGRSGKVSFDSGVEKCRGYKMAKDVDEALRDLYDSVEPR